MQDKEILALAGEVFDIEGNAILNLKKQIDGDFVEVVKTLYKSSGKVIVTGIGKSGHIGNKISATLASTGTPSFFMHPAEAFHGDLGMCGKDDIVICISNSGETDEILKLIPFFKRNGNVIIALTGNKKSTLVSNSNFHIDISVEKEACVLELAPTTSTTVTLAVGDALAIVLMKMRGFSKENFAEYHPGGLLGHRLLTRARDVMRKDHLPLIGQEQEMIDVIHAMTNGKLGLAIIVDERNKLCGLITDGDLRRAMEANKSSFFQLKASDIMTREPKTIDMEMRVLDIHERMNRFRINSLLVVDDGEVLGVVQIYNMK